MIFGQNRNGTLSQNIHGFELPCWAEDKYKIYSIDSKRENGDEHKSKRILVDVARSDSDESKLGFESESVYVRQLCFRAAEEKRTLYCEYVNAPILSENPLLNVLESLIFGLKVKAAIKNCTKTLDRENEKLQ